MLKHCKWGTCNSDSSASYASKEHMQGVKFFLFPRPCADFRLLKRDSILQLVHDASKCQQCCKCQTWINACRVEVFSKLEDCMRSHYVCSNHFVDGEPTLSNPNPLIAGSFAPVSKLCYIYYTSLCCLIFLTNLVTFNYLFLKSKINT
jgi:hypothetical protein